MHTLFFTPLTHIHTHTHTHGHHCDYGPPVVPVVLFPLPVSGSRQVTGHSGTGGARRQTVAPTLKTREAVRDRRESAARSQHWHIRTRISCSSFHFLFNIKSLHVVADKCTD